MLVRNLRLVALAIVFGSLLIPFAASAAEKHSALEEKILKLNEEMMGAEVRADIPALDQFFADDLVRMTQGGTESRANFLGAFEAGKNRYLGYDLNDVQIHMYGTTAILAGRFHLKSAAGDSQNLFADVWKEQNGKWQLLAWVTNRPIQGKPVPGDAPVKKSETAGLGALELSLLKANDEMFGAQARADTAALNRFLTGDFIRLTVDGIRNKAGFFDDLKTGKIRFEILEPNNVKVHVFGTTAILAGGFRLKDSASDTQNVFLDVWVKQKGKWQTAAWIADPHPQPQTSPAAGR